MQEIGYIYINKEGEYRTLSYSDNFKPSDHICLKIKTITEYSIEDIFTYFNNKLTKYTEENDSEKILYNKIIEKLIEYEIIDLKKLGIIIKHMESYSSFVDINMNSFSIC
jgi:hypothetical protein